MADMFEPDVELRWRSKETQVKTVIQTVERIDLGGLGGQGGGHLRQ
jgi:hypothetical protein